MTGTDTAAVPTESEPLAPQPAVEATPPSPPPPVTTASSEPVAALGAPTEAEPMTTTPTPATTETKAPSAAGMTSVSSHQFPTSDQPSLFARPSPEPPARSPQPAPSDSDSGGGWGWGWGWAKGALNKATSVVHSVAETAVRVVLDEPPSSPAVPRATGEPRSDAARSAEDTSMRASDTTTAAATAGETGSQAPAPSTSTAGEDEVRSHAIASACQPDC